MGSDMLDPFGIRPTLVWIHSVHMGQVLHWNGTVPHRITIISIWYEIADPICTRIHQVLCKHKAYPYQFRTGSKWILSCANAVLVNNKTGSEKLSCNFHLAT